MTEFGVHSEVGKLRKVMVHRPDLSLQRLTPTSHDELLFDDVLWVERAQLEHDRFVAQMRGRGVEVFLLHELLAETLAASEPARQPRASSTLLPQSWLTQRMPSPTMLHVSIRGTDPVSRTASPARMCQYTSPSMRGISRSSSMKSVSSVSWHRMS